MWLVVMLLTLSGPAEGVEKIQIRHDGVLRSVSGEVLIEAQDGGVMLRGRDGRIWTLQPDDIAHRESDPQPFAPFSGDELAEQVLAELPPGFTVHRTAHYLVFYNTSRAYAQWCGSLFERLHRAFHNFWKRRGIEVHDSMTPFVAIVFDDVNQYREFSRHDLGDAAGSVIGYYSLQTNWITTYDLTGVEGARPRGQRPTTSTVINQVLAQPAAEPNVATLIHEATHQMAFNCGLQTRFADNPLWVSEGLAVYFEVPDLTNSKGWRGIGAVHSRRLAKFRQTQAQRKGEWLTELIVSDDPFRESQRATTSYAEGWALCHFLLKRHEKQFAAYLRELADQPLLEYQSREERYRTFVKHFGPTADLQRQLESYVASL